MKGNGFLKKFLQSILIAIFIFIATCNLANAVTQQELDNYKRYLQQGSNALKVTKNYNEAIVNFEKALKINPDDYNTLCALAISYGYIGNNAKAEEILLLATRKFPNEWLAYTFLGDIKFFQKQTEAGKYYYKKAIGLSSMPQNYRVQYQQMLQKM